MITLIHDIDKGKVNRRTLVCRKCGKRPASAGVSRRYQPERRDDGTLLDRYAKPTHQTQQRRDWRF